MTSNAHPETRILGSLRSRTARGRAHRRPLRHRYRRPVVGNHRSPPPGPLVRPGRRRPPPGGEFHGRLEFWEGTGRVEACEPRRRLLVTTRWVDEPYDEVIEATLTADGDQTILVIETRGMPPDLIAAYGAGYQIHAENLPAP